jgi:glycosyltransferase involved in cell wall biosynthesis
MLRRDRTGWVLDALDDPAQELGNALQQGRPVKAAILRVRDMIFKRLVRAPDVVFTIGSSIHDPLPTLLREDYGVDRSLIVPLNQAVDIHAPAGAAARVPDASPVSPPRVLFVGFVSPVRGVDTLIEAGRILSSQGVDIVIVLVGHLKRTDRRWLEEQRRESPGLIDYLGVLPSSKTLDEMRRATLGVLPFPDRREMAPVQAVTGVENLALGKPLVATDLVGSRALVRDGVNGFIVPPGDVEAMADAIGRIVKDPALAQSMGRASRVIALRFDVNSVNRRMRAALARWL